MTAASHEELEHRELGPGQAGDPRVRQHDDAGCRFFVKNMLEALNARNGAVTEAVFENQQGNRRILMADARAVELGITPGQSLNAALALVPALQIEERNAEKESRVLERMAGWAERFTSIVSIEPPDLLLLDLMMPDFNGWDVYRVMKGDEELADIPVIVVTARVPQHGRILIEDLPPVEDYITKPFDVEQLIRSVQNLLQ